MRTVCEIRAHARRAPGKGRPSLESPLDGTSLLMAVSSTETGLEGASSGSASSGSVNYVYALSLRNGDHGRTLTPFPKRRQRHRSALSRRGIDMICFCFMHTRYTTEKLISKTYSERRGRGRGGNMYSSRAFQNGLLEALMSLTISRRS